ncbi:MAG: S46 family peptidase [Flavobacteriales bacterium]|jgi:hypothetical protein
MMISELRFLFACVAMLASLGARAKEGMWIPGMLGAAFDDMQAMGLKLSEEDLYSVNQGSIKDAIALFGGGCTAEMVSAKGLLFTNHHCGLGYIQSHSTVENDYITHGFWAKTAGEELRCAGLKITFINRMDDVTTRMLNGTEGKTAAEAELIRSANKASIESEYRKNFGADAVVRAFNYGNQYIVVVSTTYLDVRLVGAPPAGIGKFGGDTDNWVWPRHTGDFCVFRVYANADNKPAEYDPGNQPYAPAHHFPVSLDGVKEGDFSMVYGFPGRTEHLLTSYAVDYVMNRSNPMRIEMRTASLDVMDRLMRSSDAIRIQYTSKQSNIANAWKKWIGQQMGLERFDALGLKRTKEAAVTAYITPTRRTEDQAILSGIGTLYREQGDLLLARDGFVEFFYYGPELFMFAQRYADLVDNWATWKADGTLEGKLAELNKSAASFYDDFNLDVETGVFTALAPLYTSHVKATHGPSILMGWLPKGSSDWQRAATAIYGRSAFRSREALEAALRSPSKKTIQKLAEDPVFRIGKEADALFDATLNPGFRSFNLAHDDLMGRYVRVYRETFPKEKYWNDANSTLRVSYGKVEGSMPRDGMAYLWYSTADGILEKYDPKNPDFELPERMIELLENKEYGRYANNGVLHVAYTASNHTTGGNSGSPALNDQGHLAGINFDRSWESTMSDILYSPEICRNIMVDIRYVLWVIDVYAGAGYLLEEMTLVGGTRP